ncbi:MAG: DUF6164 family protein [Immundisolibacteraceae bacterium]|nr:DUF6164 family protein [Immundisolibacteraceae bacterium]
MPKLLFNLRGVPDDEAEEVRALLSENSIAYYETSPGNWGISQPALWLEDTTQLSAATELIDRYEHERMVNAQAEYARLKAQGQVPSLLDNLKSNLLRVVATLALAGALVYLPIKLLG